MSRRRLTAFDILEEIQDFTVSSSDGTVDRRSTNPFIPASRSRGRVLQNKTVSSSDGETTFDSFFDSDDKIQLSEISSTNM